MASNDDSAPNNFISGPYSGTIAADFSIPCPPFTFGVVANYTYGVDQPPPKSGTGVGEGCLNFSTGAVTDGSFVITANNGAVLRGTLVGQANLTTFTDTYTVVSGTQQFSNVTGTITATGTVDFSTNPATVTGALVPHLSH